MKKLSVEMVGSGGIAFGKLYMVQSTRGGINKSLVSDGEKEAEVSRFSGAFNASEGQLSELAQTSGIFAAHMEILRDPALYESVVQKINTDNKNAEFALNETGDELCALFEEIDDEYIRGRATDIKDVCTRIMQQLKGEDFNPFSEIKEEVIVVADELVPSDTALMDFTKVRGLITRQGGVTSHVCIIAKNKGIPAFVGMGDELSVLQPGDFIIMDGPGKEIIINPDDEITAVYRATVMKLDQQREEFKKLKNQEAETSDGHKIQIYANASSTEEVEYAIGCGASGIGLFRSEFLFMQSRDHFPDEESQFMVYRNASQACQGKSIIIRTLDIGGDKSLPYFPIHGEDNPFLGWRALRITLERKDIFKVQLRALLRASAFGQLKIMFPMIISVEEFTAAKALIENCKEELKQEGKAFNEKIGIGVMIETPASVLLAEDLAREADFFSIGTNDLVQYTLAVDRLNEKVSKLYNPFHPAVLRSIKMVADAAVKYGKPLGLCGEMAGNPQAVLFLLGMGLTSLSLAGANIPEIKQMIRNASYEQAQQLAAKVCEKSTADQVNTLLEKRNGKTHKKINNELT